MDLSTFLNDTTRNHRPQLRHSGPCGPRIPCWRPSCRAAFGALNTIEVLPLLVIARCHGDTYHPGDLALAGLVAA